MHQLLFILTLSVLLFSSCTTAGAQHSSVNEPCVSCHSKVVHDWSKSDHAKSMLLANSSSVKGDFNNKLVSHYGQKAYFFISDKTYKVKISYKNNSDIYTIKYTFGYFPLQQYLVETSKGKLQVLPFAWNAKAKEDGGQYWYHIYSKEEIKPKDRLHWRQPIQNWNGMCADCHSDGLVRNYNAKDNTFNTTWESINVGCLSCHGDMSDHKKTKHKSPLHPTLSPVGKWLRNLGDKTASWQGTKRDNSFMDTCFACHSLRAPLTDGFSPDKLYLDQFTPQLLSPPEYHADGQINGEVYIYGSFLQSKMYASGVNCLDCHDKHTMKIKIIGNGLCLQCHSSGTYNVKSHHQHKTNSTGSQCVNCHMTSNRYMGVDDRRDHSFKIPRPDISEKFNTPNACLNCHTKKNNNWAKSILLRWHGKPEVISTNKFNFIKLQSGINISLEDHLAIIADKKLDDISRATALGSLRFNTLSISGKTLRPYLQNKNGLIRLSATVSGNLLSTKDQQKFIGPLLNDPLKAIRIAAARILLTSKNIQLKGSNNNENFRLAYQELLTVNDINSWRAEGRINQAKLALYNKNLLEAENLFIQTITIEPYFSQGYLELSEYYRKTNQLPKEKKTLLLAIARLPHSASINYGYGLYLVRDMKYKLATNYFKQASLTAPLNEQYLYTYVLALDGQGQTTLALNHLTKFSQSFKNSQLIKTLGLYLAQKQSNLEAYKLFK